MAALKRCNRSQKQSVALDRMPPRLTAALATKLAAAGRHARRSAGGAGRPVAALMKRFPEARRKGGCCNTPLHGYQNVGKRK